MRILAIQSSVHDCSAAAFDDYRLVAAVSEERLTRVKGQGGKVPWLAIDEVLRIAGWRRNDVDVIATTRGLFPTYYERFSLLRDVHYAVQRWRGRERRYRDLWVMCHRYGTPDAHSLFRTENFLADNSFRPDTRLHFVNHHEAHALPALFFTDWDDALVYTSDGVGDNVSYSMRTLRNGKLECHFGDDRWLTRKMNHAGLASAYGQATEACGFKMFRHEGKLTGLAAYGEPTLAEPMAKLFRFDEATGEIDTDFSDWETMRRTYTDLCKGHSRETIAASIQQVTEDYTLRSVRWWQQRTGGKRLALSGGLFGNVRLNRLLAEQLPIEEIFIFRRWATRD